MSAIPTAFMLVALLATAMHAHGQVTHVSLQHGEATLSAAVAPAGAPLVFTAQLLPLNEQGRVSSDSDAAAQTQHLLQRLEGVLQRCGSSIEGLVRLNLYAAGDEAAQVASRLIAAQTQAPLSIVVTDQPQPGVLVSLDAVAVARDDIEGGVTQDAALLRGSGATFISGQAAKGDMATATRDTMAGLGRTLQFLNLVPDDVVHVKAFLQPMQDAATARQEIDAFFAPNPAPPLTLVQWTMKAPIEIELVVKESRREATGGDTIEFLTPPWFQASPIYCKVTVVRHGSLIFTSGLVSSAGGKQPSDEVRDMFVGLRELITKAGGDMKHLAKATYYPATDATSKALNDVRPEFYDPQRPPAASKAPARGTGVSGRNITIDLIGVTPPPE